MFRKNGFKGGQRNAPVIPKQVLLYKFGSLMAYRKKPGRQRINVVTHHFLKRVEPGSGKGVAAARSDQNNFALRNMPRPEPCGQTDVKVLPEAGSCQRAKVIKRAT